MADARFTDVVLKRDADGIYDLALDGPTSDLATTQGYETALMCSLFSDRRAAADEVGDPFKRRGWIGNLVADTPGDNYGSGLWLYEQRRGTQEVCTALAQEARTSLSWMIDESLVSTVSPTFTYDPAKRRMVLNIVESAIQGGVLRRTFEIWDATARGLLATNT